MNLDIIKRAIPYYSKFDSKEEVMKSLKEVNLGTDEKNFIWTYLYPEPLLDYELPSVVQAYLHKNPGINLLNPDFGFNLIMVRAIQTPQYKRFMRFLLHSFIEKPDQVFPVDGEGSCSCPICGKTIYRYQDCQGNRDILAYGSDQTELCLDLGCLAQLGYLHGTMEKITPGYL